MAKSQPIKSKKKIENIKALLQGRTKRQKLRDYCIFIWGINTNLRGIDLTELDVGQVRYLKPGDTFDTKERKTKKSRRVRINGVMYKAVQPYLKDREPMLSDDEPLFLSDKLKTARKGRLHPDSVGRLVREWCEAVGLHGSYGSHTLRKTAGNQRHKALPHVATRTFTEYYNHSSERQTRDYLGIDDADLFELEMFEV